VVDGKGEEEDLLVDEVLKHLNIGSIASDQKLCSLCLVMHPSIVRKRKRTKKNSRTPGQSNCSTQEKNCHDVFLLGSYLVRNEKL
jgi:hypothetical protein